MRQVRDFRLSSRANRGDLISFISFIVAVAVILGATPSEAAFPGKNGKIAFQSLFRGIETIESDGSGRSALVLGGEDVSDPAWSPSGTKLAFGVRIPFEAKVYASDADGGNPTPLTNYTVFDFYHPFFYDPTWSAEGSRIVFIEDVFISPTSGSVQRLAWLNSDGSGSPNYLGSGWEPQWSPLGDKIAFTDDGTICSEAPNPHPPPLTLRTCNTQIYTVSPDGTGRTRITDDTTSDFDPNWSPDGSKIVFSSRQHGHGDIYVMNSDGSERTRLTDSPADDLSPAWSPDGTKIVFTTDRDETDPNCGSYLPCDFNIYTMNADGSGQTRLTDEFAAEIAPDWQPLVNSRPDCSGVAAMPNVLWPPNNRFRTVSLGGASDPDSDAVTITIDGVTQDEPVGRRPDAGPGGSPNEVKLRAQRRSRGGGRIYRISFTASDGTDQCSSVAVVEVRQRKGHPAVDSRPPSHDSFGSERDRRLR